MKTRWIALLMMVLTMVLFITACSSGSSSGNSARSTTSLDGASILQERCTVCHNLSRVERAKHTPEEWQTTVNRMIGKGAKLSSDEKTLLIEYLSTTYGN
jgi:cytochrome c2